MQQHKHQKEQQYHEKMLTLNPVKSDLHSLRVMVELRMKSLKNYSLKKNNPIAFYQQKWEKNNDCKKNTTERKDR